MAFLDFPSKLQTQASPQRTTPQALRDARFHASLIFRRVFMTPAANIKRKANERRPRRKQLLRTRAEAPAARLASFGRVLIRTLAASSPPSLKCKDETDAALPGTDFTGLFRLSLCTGRFWPPLPFLRAPQ
ncbi:hypothetical protein SKAU_G00086680 [Synaphobranchus kaupii]|uniref:Uncharacterized protein n=1 Tax=Synaphobranchus kaupii TaxID=118154 RepID=A0A9Q1J3U5_SYNKA|nr:hypothetical protein SKAU_G00086680 [Synaphobranchus kaupii]